MSFLDIQKSLGTCKNQWFCDILSSPIYRIFGSNLAQPGKRHQKKRQYEQAKQMQNHRFLQLPSDIGDPPKSPKKTMSESSRDAPKISFCKSMIFPKIARDL